MSGQAEYGGSEYLNQQCSLHHRQVVLTLRYGYGKIPYRILERISMLPRALFKVPSFIDAVDTLRDHSVISVVSPSRRFLICLARYSEYYDFCTLSLEALA